MYIPFKKEHLEVMSMREIERNLISDRLVALYEDSDAITAVIDGRVICCGGVYEMSGGNSEIWLIPSVYIENYKKTFQEELKELIEYYKNKLSLTRMQTCCVDDEMHNKWMESLGFKDEGGRECYCNGIDYRAWGKVWKS